MMINGKEALHLSDSFLESLDECQQKLLLVSESAKTTFDFKLDDYFIQNFNSEFYHALPTIKSDDTMLID